MLLLTRFGDFMNHVQKWWNDEIVPQIRNHGTPMLFPTEDIEDYIFESPNGESELLKELNSWVDEIITTYQNLPKNEPVAVWDDEGKFVLTMRELFLMRAMESMGEIKISETLESGYYPYGGQ